jgi:hypothetical protein
MELLPVNNLPDYLKVLVYGRPDAGKTTFGASGANHEEFSPTVIMDIEGGLQSVRWAGKGLLRTPRIETTAQIEEVILAAASRAGAFAEAKCLVVDSLTKMAKILLHDIVARKHAARARKGGVDQVEISDYGDLGKAMERYVDFLIDLDMHIVFIALEKDVKSDDDGPVTDITINLPGQLPKKIIAACDNVFALKKIAPVAATDEQPGQPASVAMLTQQSGIQFARTRNAEFSDELGTFIMNPTLPGIWDKYQSALEAGRQKVQG